MEKIRYFRNKPITTENDLETINHLVRQLSPQNKIITLDQIRSVMCNGFIFYARNSAGTIVGIAVLTRIHKLSGFSGTMENVVVDRDYRGQGIGTKLVTKLLAVAKKVGMKKVEFTCRPDNLNANQFYVSLGAARRETNIYRFVF